MSDGLNADELALLRQFATVTRHGITNECWDDHAFVFETVAIHSRPAMAARVKKLSAFQRRVYDCCPASCCCFVGPWTNCDTCPYCDHPRHRSDGSPFKTFSALPLIPQLLALFSSSHFVDLMLYRSQYCNEMEGRRSGSEQSANTPCDQIGDVYDSENWHNCKHLFEDPHDVALLLTTDGFAPFKKRHYSAWPLLLINLNLPPSERMKHDNLICVGVIPGPKAPKDLDSFVIPVIEELEVLQDGIDAFDRSTMEAFTLRAHIIDICGDMPAVAKLTRMKGPVAKKPCRRCDIEGVRVPGSRSTAHYCPLHRSKNLGISSPGSRAGYAADDLPARTLLVMLQQAYEVETAETDAESERLSTLYGINGQSSFCRLRSFRLPHSIPHDLMHLIWENLIKNLVAAWQGSWKSLDHSEYAISKREWDKIGEAVGTSGRLIPGCFGAVLPNFVARPSEMTAEKWSFFTLYLAPIVLFEKFPHPQYYQHFTSLIPILHLLIALELREGQVTEIENGLRRWVEEYERYGGTTYLVYLCLAYMFGQLQTLLCWGPSSSECVSCYDTCTASPWGKYTDCGSIVGVLGLPYGTILWTHSACNTLSSLPMG